MRIREIRMTIGLILNTIAKLAEKRIEIPEVLKTMRADKSTFFGGLNPGVMADLSGMFRDYLFFDNNTLSPNPERTGKDVNPKSFDGLQCKVYIKSPKIEADERDWRDRKHYEEITIAPYQKLTEHPRDDEVIDANDIVMEFEMPFELLGEHLARAGRLFNLPRDDSAYAEILFGSDDDDESDASFQNVAEDEESREEESEASSGNELSQSESDSELTESDSDSSEHQAMNRAFTDAMSKLAVEEELEDSDQKRCDSELTEEELENSDQKNSVSKLTESESESCDEQEEVNDSETKSSGSTEQHVKEKKIYEILYWRLAELMGILTYPNSQKSPLKKEFEAGIELALQITQSMASDELEEFTKLYTQRFEEDPTNTNLLQETYNKFRNIEMPAPEVDPSPKFTR